jgi:hypothetical protein
MNILPKQEVFITVRSQAVWSGLMRMFQVLRRTAGGMAGSSRLKTALFLGVLMLLGGPFGAVFSNGWEAPSPSVLKENAVEHAIGGENASFLLAGDDRVSTSFTVDVPSDAPVTNIHLTMEPSVQPTQTGFVWDDSSAWSATTAVHNGTFGSDGKLTGDGGGTLWDFDTGLQGWTVSDSSYVAPSPSTLACGVNGTTGGSFKTQASSSPEHATSPAVNLAGLNSIPLHAWILQGSFSCGEEADSNENLRVQYKTTSGTWTTHHTWQGSTSGGTVEQYMTTLPAAALHASTQIRFEQTSGSGTCCDYWFIDDVHLALPPSADWTSPSIGFGANNFQTVNAGPWAPLYLDATVPSGAGLNWTVLDATTGQAIEGFHGTGSGWIPTNGLDWNQHTSIKVLLYFEPAPDGRMATVHSISGDGLMAAQFDENPIGNGWVLTGNAYHAPVAPEFPALLPSINGSVNDTAISPWISASGSVVNAFADAELTNANASIRYAENDAWSPIALPFSQNLANSEGNHGRLQLKFSFDHSIPVSNGTGNGTANGTGNTTGPTTPEWSISHVEMGLMGGLQPASPSIDFEGDGVLEWGGSDVRVGSWGFQDRFENGATSLEVNPGILGAANGKAWIPVVDLTSFSFTALSSNGALDNMVLRVGNDEIAQWDLDGSSHISLDSDQLDTLSTTLASLTSTVGALGTSFAEVTFEVTGTGDVLLSGLSVPYAVSASIDVGSDSAFVLAMNTARYGLTPSNGLHQITLPFSSATPGGLKVSIEGLNTSSAVQLVGSEMIGDLPVLAPSQHWQTMNTTYNLYGSAASLARLDVSDGANTSTWLLPFNGGSPVGLSGSEHIELHPDTPLVVEENGVATTISITFRVEPSWDDAQQMRVTSRIVLSNTVISIPSVHFWGDSGQQGYENDLEIQEVVFTDVDNGRTLESSDYYLKAGIQVDLSIRVGFEGLDSTDAFADGDAILSIYRGETLVANTTALDENYWNYSDQIPFTFGELTWRFEIASLNGSGLTEDAIIERTFHIDSINPQVLSTSMDLYDHRTPSSTQTIQIQITDQPLLPTDVQAMVWREWIDDTNLNHWPDADEYQSLGLYVPNDLTGLIGQYTLLLDDTGGSLGQKVAVYITGADDAGQLLEKGGSSENGKHLFMYQLAIDGSPSIAPGAFSFESGREPWLHPATPYTLNVDISEPNGGSDLTDVIVELASNQGSDPLPIQWDFSTGNCTTLSPHLVVLDCTMVGADGPADPYERDITLNVEFLLAWTTPDLGETRREPGVRVIDRAGQEVFKTFPEHRWRFSAALEIPEETVTLVLSQGTLLGDGARLAPNSPMEIAGGVVFSQTNAVPVFDCEINVLFAGSTYSATTFEGVWSMALNAPSQSGTLPLTWTVGCLEGQGVDATDKETSVRWIVIDGTGPEPVEVLNPRPQAVLAAESHEVRVVLSEEGGLDVESLQLVWWVEEKSTGDRLRNGVEPLNLLGQELSGLRLEVLGTIDLSGITPEMLENRLELHIVVAGRDLADNEVLGLGATPAGTPVGIWDMEWLKPAFELEQGAVTYSRTNIEVGQTSIVTATIKNTGTLDGSVDLVFTIVDADGNRSTLRRTTADVPKDAELAVQVDWNPETPGLQWIEVALENEQSVSGPSIDVRPTREESFSERVFGNVNPIIGSVAGLLFISIVVTGLLYATRMTRKSGSKAEYDWDEYSSELEDEEDEDDDDFEEIIDSNASSKPIAEAAVSATTAATTASAADKDEATDWVRGSDGYWWYHDKATNEWWYKDSEGNIVRHD